MKDLTVYLEESEKKGRAYIGDPSNSQAEMTFSKAGSKLIIINHTEVGSELRGLGVGRKLLDAIVEMVRTKNLKVLPLCPYAKSVFIKDESIRDILN